MSKITPEKLLKIGKHVRPGVRTKTQKEKEEIRAAILENKDFVDWCVDKNEWTHEEQDNLQAILELPLNEKGFYEDLWGRPVAYNGIRTLRREKSEFKLNKIHKAELEKCKNDYFYFRKNYTKIVTRDGIMRPEPRDYQVELEETLLSMEDTVVLFPRQSGKTVTTGTYLLWRALFHEDPINIGILANKPSLSMEVLDKIKKIFVEIPIWMQRGIVAWNKGSIEFDNGTRFLTDGPSSDSFRGFTINLLYVDEAAYIKKTLWDEFVDSVMPTMNSLVFKQVIITSTANGMNHFEKIVTNAKNGITGDKFVTTSWTNVPHYDKNGKLIPPDEYKKRVIAKYGEKFFKQTEENEFLGSSDTLVSGLVLNKILERVEKAEKIPQSLIANGNMYKKVQENHNYILSVDTAKDGLDSFSLHVIDVSQFPFEQVFSANLQVDYLMMPEHLVELGMYYNAALIIIENNEGSGQSVADQLWQIYEYPNIYKDKNLDGRVGYKKYPGFRTTIKSRNLIINMLKIFLEEQKLIINDKETLNQLFTFTKRKNGNKYEADDGYHDDLVMALAIMFAPFMEIKVFDNFELFVKQLRIENSTQKASEFLSALDIGFTTDQEEDKYQEIKRMLIEEGETDFSPAY